MINYVPTLGGLHVVVNVRIFWLNLKQHTKHSIQLPLNTVNRFNRLITVR